MLRMFCAQKLMTAFWGPINDPAVHQKLYMYSLMFTDLSSHPSQKECGSVCHCLRRDLQVFFLFCGEIWLKQLACFCSCSSLYKMSGVTDIIRQLLSPRYHECNFLYCLLFNVARNGNVVETHLNCLSIIIIPGKTTTSRYFAACKKVRM